MMGEEEEGEAADATQRVRLATRPPSHILSGVADLPPEERQGNKKGASLVINPLFNIMHLLLSYTSDNAYLVKRL